MRRKMLGQLPPGTTSAQDIENRVQHFTHWPNTTAACLGRWRHERRNDLPFLVAQIAAIAQMVTFMPRTGLGRPHRSLQGEGDSSLFRSASHRPLRVAVGPVKYNIAIQEGQP